MEVQGRKIGGVDPLSWFAVLGGGFAAWRALVRGGDEEMGREKPTISLPRGQCGTKETELTSLRKGEAPREKRKHQTSKGSGFPAQGSVCELPVTAFTVQNLFPSGASIKLR